jgi:hypothetical protein
VEREQRFMAARHEYSGRVEVKVPVTLFTDGKSTMVTSSGKRNCGLHQGRLQESLAMASSRVSAPPLPDLHNL